MVSCINFLRRWLFFFTTEAPAQHRVAPSRVCGTLQRTMRQATPDNITRRRQGGDIVRVAFSEAVIRLMDEKNMQNPRKVGSFFHHFCGFIDGN